MGTDEIIVEGAAKMGLDYNESDGPSKK